MTGHSRPKVCSPTLENSSQRRSFVKDKVVLGFGPLGANSHGARQPLPYGAVALAGGLWGAWVERNRRVTIPHGLKKLEEYGNLDNFRRLIGESDADFRGQLFADSDIYKTLEAIAWELGRSEDGEMREFFESTVNLLARAQTDDGYLDSAYQGRDDHLPWTNFEHGHELYCLGHLIQAAIAAKRAINDDRLLEIAFRFIAHVDERFGAEEDVEYAGHPLIEMALVELSRETGEQKFLDLAERFIRRRGSRFIGDARFGAPYYQDDSAVLDTEIMRGHAVRAIYLNEGATDLYLERGDGEFLAAMEKQWNDLVTRRMYVTAGVGSRHQDEAFGTAFEFPADRAYSETCAGIALFGWAWRMYLATGESHFLDVGEKALYNVVLTGISEAGDTFTYSNPLQRRPNHLASREEEAAKRLSWFDCACCPPNLMRTFGSIEHYAASLNGDVIEIANYANVDLTLGETTVKIRTDYPARETIDVDVTGGNGTQRLAFRIPGWAEPSAVRLEVDGIEVPAEIGAGWARPEVALTAGMKIRLTLPMDAQKIYPHPRIDAVRGTIAVTRGPVVYCADAVDNDHDIDLAEVRPGDIQEVGGIHQSLGPALSVPVDVHEVRDDVPLYAPATLESSVTRGELRLRPYATWGEQSEGSMRVWLPHAPAELKQGGNSN